MTSVRSVRAEPAAVPSLPATQAAALEAEEVLARLGSGRDTGLPTEEAPGDSSWPAPTPCAPTTSPRSPRCRC